MPGLRTRQHRKTLRRTYRVDQRASLTGHVHQVHPYESPEWIVAPAEQVSEKYLSWARANSSIPPL
ncbi:MAG: divalent cation tolerance protein CutA [Opitutus sp.]|nr:divalent cation tolerance protein CutA [Opitutus sp.]